MDGIHADLVLPSKNPTNKTNHKLSFVSFLVLSHNIQTKNTPKYMLANTLMILKTTY